MISSKISTPRFVRILWVLVLMNFVASNLPADQWSIKKQANPEGPGSWLSIYQNDQILAAWTYGEGQFKPYLHVFGPEATRLTNSGLDVEGNKSGRFGHHRGIFIGWNRVLSEFGRRDLWHMKNGASMEIDEFTQLVTTGSHARTEARILWRAGQTEPAGDDLLIEEHRRFKVSKHDSLTTQIDFHTTLTAARDLQLSGDRQHAGIHFRAENEVAERSTETAYVWSPDIPVAKQGMISEEWQWASLIFPIGDRWFRSTEMTAPANKFRELSWRDYGRFGFFDKRELKEGESIDLRFRFLVSELRGIRMPEDLQDLKATTREDIEAAYQAFIEELSETGAE